MNLRATSPGIVFRLEGGQIRARVTKRADLFVSRLKHQRDRAADLERAKRRGEGMNLTVTIEIVGIIVLGSEALAVKMLATLRRTFCRPGSGDAYSMADVSKVLLHCRRQKLTVHGLQSDPKEKPAIRKAEVEIRTVPDPMISRASLIEKMIEQEDWEQITIEDRRNASRTNSPPPRSLAPEMAQPGYQYAAVNMVSLVGGFSRLRGRTDVQTEAVAEYRRLADQAQLGGARAIDYENVKVDTSGPTADMVANTGYDARHRYYEAREAVRRDDDPAIGGKRLAVLDAMAVAGQNVAAAAKAAGLGSSGPARRKATNMAIDAADRLARQFGYLTSHRSEVRFDGDRRL